MKKIKAMAIMLTLLSVPALVIADAVTMTGTVDKFMTATFQYSSVAYGSLSAGSSNNVAPNQASGVYNVSVSTNYLYKVSASGTDFSDGGVNTFGIGNLTMDSHWSAVGLAEGNSIALATGSQDVDNNIGEGNTTSYHGFWLDIPAAQPAAAYTSTLTVTVTNE